MSNKLLQAATAIGSIFSFNALGHAAEADYQFEVGASLDRLTYDLDAPPLPDLDVPDTDIWAAYGTYYFAPVTTKDVPLSEAAFLGRASSMTAGASHIDTGPADFDALYLLGELYVPNSMFYLGAGVTHFETSNESPFSTLEGEDTNWSVAAGLTPLKGLLVTTFYDHETGYDPNVNVKYVGKMSNSHWYGAELTLADPSNGDFTYRANFDFYFDPTLKAGVVYGDAGDEVGLSVEKFFLPNLVVGLSASTADGGDSYGLRAAFRF